MTIESVSFTSVTSFSNIIFSRYKSEWSYNLKNLAFLQPDFRENLKIEFQSHDFNHWNHEILERCMPNIFRIYISAERIQTLLYTERIPQPWADTNQPMRSLPGIDSDIRTALRMVILGVVLAWQYSTESMFTLTAVTHSSMPVVSYSWNKCACLCTVI